MTILSMKEIAPNYLRRCSYDVMPSQAAELELESSELVKKALNIQADMAKRKANERFTSRLLERTK